MKKRNIIIISSIALAILIGGSIVLMLQQGSSTDNATKNAVSTNQIAMKDMAFSPANVTVKANTTVTWTNDDTVKHSITSYDGHIPNSQDLSKGQSYSYTFTKTGTFKYHCGIHPNMTGLVIVTQ